MKIFLAVIITVAFTVSGGALAWADHDFQKGISEYKKRDFRAAVKHLSAYVEATPDPRAYYLLGYASYKLKDFDASRRYFREAYLLDPGFDPRRIELK